MLADHAITLEELEAEKLYNNDSDGEDDDF
jgi:hypothetical protein